MDHTSTSDRGGRPEPTSRHQHQPLQRLRRRASAGVAAAVLAGGLLPAVVPFGTAAAAPVGQGFHLNASDLRFIAKQIKIAEAHVANTTSETGPCGALLGSGPDQIPPGGVGVTLPWGLRTVDGSCNNLIDGQDTFGTADQVFPRLTPKSLRVAENGTSYAQTAGTVMDSQPRMISNLLVDQTASNPAAVAAAGYQDGDPVPAGALEIANEAPDTGLSAPYNSWFTLFGQFFDHGLDLVSKGGRGSVFVPLKADDPLYDADGADDLPGTGDELNFMVLTRATHSGSHEAFNQTSPFVDQSQTYSSHPSHQVFLRAYALDADGAPEATGALVVGPGGGMATWAEVKEQARTMLGIALSDDDALSVPMIATDPYGRFLPGPNGFPQLVVPSAPGGLVEGDPAAPVPTTGASRSGHAFLDDIAHHAVPGAVDHDRNPGTPRQPAVPDADPGTTDDGDPATYDDEMLAAHFIAGDGRVNENIGLIAVHHVFHSEHNRLAAEIDAMLDGPEFTDAERADWRATDRPAGWDYGERLFQAARFVTEMEYQHLAFEEFIRKAQPMVNAFGEGGTGYRTDTDPAISAEFAHAVYRFGHSMLNESVDRVRPDGSRDDIPLLDAFLNPPAFMAGGLSPEEAAGNIVRGMTRQVGNELDEFVTEALRNELLGLPLDLAALNIARARDTGIARLNEARRAFYEQTGNSALAPYTSWADFGFAIKHPESLPNFIAAYGAHPTITGATTVAGKRAAAAALLAQAADEDPAVNAEPQAFLNSTGAWANQSNGATTTGVDDIDLWVGGLAEKRMVAGGLLGPTFNYVFEAQAEALQDGDRFYYLTRTAGLNLLTQLEGNSFAELIQRNTDVAGLPADSFARPDLVFHLDNLGTSGSVTDDTSTPEYDESRLLVREPNGTIRYGGDAHVVFNGTAGDDRVRSSEGDDTLRGNDGNDRMEGGDGADNHIGGLGDDILTDLFGDDVLKGGDGNDTLSSGQGFGGDLNQGGRGNDFIVGGNDMTETFAGPGDDFVFAGDGLDTVFGDDGDDWLEGGKGPFNLLQGDNGAPFQDDPNEPGHDVLDGDGGEQDFDAEGGDDIMLAGPGIQRAEGMLGFDWVTHKGDPQAGDSDMAITGLLPPAVETNRDRFDLVEALSGWRFDDTLRGDDRDEAEMDGHQLDQDGIDRVEGLVDLLPVDSTGFTGGNILLGGAGSDLIEGRGGDDLIDGDAWLDAQISVPDPVSGGTRLVDNMAAIRTDVLAGRINPGDLRIQRTIRVEAPDTALDVAVFSEARDAYELTAVDGAVRVAHLDGTLADGTDLVRNVEVLRFTDLDLQVSSVVSNTPTAGTLAISDLTPTQGGLLTATAADVVDPDGVGDLTFTWQREDTAGAWSDVATGETYAPVAADVGSRLRVVATFTDTAGAAERIESAPTAPVITTPGAPTIGSATADNASATVRWSPPADTGGAPITGWSVQARTGTGLVQVTTDPAVVPADATSVRVTGLTNGTSYRFVVAAVNEVGTGATSALSNAVTPVAPDTTAPRITARSPQPGATRVGRGTNVVVTFSEAMDAASLTRATFTLTRAGGQTVRATVGYDARRRRATLNPSADLARNTVYTVTVTRTVTDVARNPLAGAPVTWRFRTR